jgi:hypothetical protein
MNNQVKVSILSVFLGVLFAYVSVIVLGYAATVAVPEFAKSSPMVAISAIDLIAAGLPLSIIFVVFALIIKRVGHNKSYLPYILLALPFFALHIFIGAFAEFNSVFFATTLPKYIVVVICVAYFVKRQGPVKA